MEHKWEKLIAYYKPYKGLSFADLIFAVAGTGMLPVIPLIVRYITSSVVYLPGDEPFRMPVKTGAY